MTSQLPDDEGDGRRTCYRCFRPSALCLCSAIRRVDNRTEVIIVQHPRERQHAFGTARLVELSLSRTRVLVDHLGCLRRDPSALAPLEGAALLYPHATARDVTTLPESERPGRLVVIDGTWHHARTLYRDIPALRALPHLTLPEHLRSGFRIRRQPRRECLSTIEAVGHALDALEPGGHALGPLLEAFGAMQDRQLHLPRNAGRSRSKKRQRASRAIPRALVENFASLVVVYAESALASPGKRELLSCAALRPATDERFFGLLAGADLSDAHLGHLGHTRQELRQGMSASELRDAWRSFLAPGDVLASWSPATLKLLGAAGLDTPGGVSLKGAYGNLGRSRGSLERVVASERLRGAAPVGRRSRALERLDRAVLLSRFLHRVGTAGSAGTSPLQLAQ